MLTLWGGSCLYIGNVTKVERWDWTFIALRRKWGCSIGQEASSWGGRCGFGALCSLRWTLSCELDASHLFSPGKSKQILEAGGVANLFQRVCSRLLSNNNETYATTASAVIQFSHCIQRMRSVTISQTSTNVTHWTKMMVIKFTTESLLLHTKKIKKRDIYLKKPR